jgi:hypothetical protein
VPVVTLQLLKVIVVRLKDHGRPLIAKGLGCFAKTSP